MSFIKPLPRDCQRLDIVADTYIESSIKGGTRSKRGESEKILITSVRSKTPRDFHKFMLKSENKTRLIEVMFDYIAHNRAKILNLLRCTKIYLSSMNECKS